MTINRILRSYHAVLTMPYGLYRLPADGPLDLHTTLRRLQLSGKRSQVRRIVLIIFRSPQAHPMNRIDAAIRYSTLVARDAASGRGLRRIDDALALLRGAGRLAKRGANRIRILDHIVGLMRYRDPDETMCLAVRTVRLYRDRMHYARRRRQPRLIKRYAGVLPRQSLAAVYEESQQSRRLKRLLMSFRKAVPRSIRHEMRHLRTWWLPWMPRCPNEDAGRAKHKNHVRR